MTNSNWQIFFLDNLDWAATTSNDPMKTPRLQYYTKSVLDKFVDLLEDNTRIKVGTNVCICIHVFHKHLTIQFPSVAPFSSNLGTEQCMLIKAFRKFNQTRLNILSFARTM